MNGPLTFFQLQQLRNQKHQNNDNDDDDDDDFHLYTDYRYKIYTLDQEAIQIQAIML